MIRRVEERQEVIAGYAVLVDRRKNHKIIYSGREAPSNRSCYGTKDAVAIFPANAKR